ncbi:hypothetical protein JTB14_019634 [Gonioctena quinquepunctata]|nr:hypothetical protein JTB14_019634 [Gonioctena quinquepunctata]
MDSRLAGIKGVMPYFDDVLIVAESTDQLEVKLRSVLKRFKEDGLRLRADKCEFFVCQVKFLGFLITEDGISPTNEKIKPIQEAPAPTSKLELQAFLGMLNFFHLFLENKATVAEPLHKLLHKVIVSDNATAFTSSEFQIFLTNNLIRRARIAPYHPASNGQAERMVQTTKHFFKMLKDGDIKTKLARFLMQQHSTPISTTGNSPAEILMNRKLQTRLSSLHPKVLETSKNQTLEEDAPEVMRQFRAKDPVFARNYGNGPKWSPAFIKKSLGPVSYRLDTPEGNVLHRHVDQIRRRQEEIDSSPILSDRSNSPRIGNGKQLLDTVDENEGQRDANVQVDVSEPISGGQVIQNKPVRATRPRNPPRYLKDYTS